MFLDQYSLRQAEFAVYGGSTKQGLQTHMGLRGREGPRQQLQAGRVGLLLPLASQWPSGTGE